MITITSAPQGHLRVMAASSIRKGAAALERCLRPAARHCLAAGADNYTGCASGVLEPATRRALLLDGDFTFCEQTLEQTRLLAHVHRLMRALSGRRSAVLAGAALQAAA